MDYEGGVGKRIEWKEMEGGKTTLEGSYRFSWDGGEAKKRFCFIWDETEKSTDEGRRKEFPRVWVYSGCKSMYYLLENHKLE
jgi:hypothetical protein